MMRADVNDEDPRLVLVQTKLMVPVPRVGLVSRPQLVEILASGREAKLTLVCAPTGGEDERIGAVGEEQRQRAVRVGVVGR